MDLAVGLGSVKPTSPGVSAGSVHWGEASYMRSFVVEEGRRAATEVVRITHGHRRGCVDVNA